MFKMKHILKKKALVFLLGLTVLTLPLDAQVLNHSHQYSNQEQTGTRGLFRRGFEGGHYHYNQKFDDGQNGGYDIQNQTFGQDNNEAPLGSGLFILAAAGFGYAFKKRKNNKKQ